MRGAFRTPVSPGPSALMPDRVGPYRIVRRLGRGGMGVVYEAAESNPTRRVALKVLVTDFDDPRAQMRFENECQVLAHLQHPAIAQIHTAGSVPLPTGVAMPYFAMELAHGAVPITRFVEDRAFSTRRRIELFLEVLDGVQHGHERGIVHRDLKPANILVDDEGRPKIIDFGLSRATGTGLGLAPLQTRSGELLGTPHYMSPEQTTTGRAVVDERADVYSLGVVLFELLTGRLPYDVEGLGVFAIAQCVREQPALRLGAVDEALRGDLETIVGKALEKLPARRYLSVADLAEDLRRYLNSEAIAARPPSAPYQLRLFARRNKALVAGMLGVFLVSITGTIVSSVYAVRAEQRARDLNREIYTQQLTVARAAIDTGDFHVASEELARTAPERRGWEWRVLGNQATRSELAFSVPGDPRQLPRCGFVEGGRTLLTWRDGGDVVSGFDTGTGARSFELRVGASVQHAVPDPNGTRLFAMSAGEVVAWDVREGSRTWSREVEPGEGCLEFAPSRDRLAVVVKGATEILWLDVGTGRPVRETPVPVGLRTRSFVLADPEDRWVYVAGAAGTRFVDPHTGERLREIPASTWVALDRNHGDLWELPQVPRRSRSLDGRTLVRRDPRTLEPTLRLDMNARRGGPVHVAVSPRGGLLACSYGDGTVLLHDSRSGSEVVELDVMARAPALHWSPDGDVLVGLTVDGDLHLWRHVAAGKPFEFAMEAGARDGAIDTAGRRVVSKGWERASLFDVLTGELLWSVPRPSSMQATSLRGELLVHADKRDGLALLDAADGAERWYRGLGIRTNATAISADGRRVFSGHPDGVVRAWDARTGEALFASTLHGAGRVRDIAVLERHDRVASAGADGVVLWNGRTGEPLLRLPVPECRRVSWSPEGERIAAVCGDRVEVWDAGSGDRVATLEAGGPLDDSDVAFLPGGSRCVVVDTNGGVEVWDTETWELVVRLRTRRSSSGYAARSLAVQGEDRLVVFGGGSVVLLEASPVEPEVAARRDALARADLLIDTVLEGELLVDRALEDIGRATWVDRSTRQLAIDQLEARGQNARELDEAAWLLCRHRGGTAEQFERALALAEAACADQPDRRSFQNTLGLARYRNLDYAGAVEVLGRSGQDATEPTDLAFLAASLHALGRTSEAQTVFARLRDHAGYPDFGNDLETRHLVREAEATLQVPGVPR